MAMRARAEEGSPWVPVAMMTTLCGGSLSTSLSLIRTPGGISRYPSFWAMAAFSTMLRPAMATWRPWRTAQLTTCWMREISEAKVATMMRPLASRNTSSKAASTTRSEGVKPGRSALVESESSASTPRPPSSASLAMSVGFPSTGVWSNLKSPEWTIRPTGVSMASPTPSGMLWQTWKNSMRKGPMVRESPAWMVFNSTSPSSLCSFSLTSMRPRVSLVA